MTAIERIDSIYTEMQTANLSGILPMLLPIALECGDYKGYYLLSLLNKPTCKEKHSNATLHNEIDSILMAEGLSKESVGDIARAAVEDYISLSTIGKGKVLALSAIEMEYQMNACNEARTRT